MKDVSRQCGSVAGHVILGDLQHRDRVTIQFIQPDAPRLAHQAVAER